MRDPEAYQIRYNHSRTAALLSRTIIHVQTIQLLCFNRLVQVTTKKYQLERPQVQNSRCVAKSVVPRSILTVQTRKGYSETRRTRDGLLKCCCMQGKISEDAGTTFLSERASTSRLRMRTVSLTSSIRYSVLSQYILGSSV